MPALRVEGLSVRFGGIAAVDDVSITLDAGAVVGLIGANGAGKSTLMNAISGFVPSRGRIELFGQDISAGVVGTTRPRRARSHVPTSHPVSRPHRARDGRHRARGTRTHVAHDHGARTPCLPPTRASARWPRPTSSSTSSDSGATPTRSSVSSRPATRRIAELACLLALDARVLCLDEPTAGVAQRETEAFGPLLLRIRAELDATLLVIEHDMPLIFSITDKVYCLETGKVIASGTAGGRTRQPARRLRATSAPTNAPSVVATSQQETRHDLVRGRRGRERHPHPLRPNRWRQASGPPRPRRRRRRALLDSGGEGTRGHLRRDHARRSRARSHDRRRRRLLHRRSSRRHGRVHRGAST